MSKMAALFLKILVWVFLLELAATEDDNFIFNGFKSANLSLDGVGYVAEITSNGLLRLTDSTVSAHQMGHAFYPIPIHFKESLTGSVFSFSTTFVFGIVPKYSDLGGQGIALAISPSKELHANLDSQFLGLFNSANNGKSSNHILAVELDTTLSSEFGDIDNNHVGIDINGLRSNKSSTAGYFTDDTGGFENLSLVSGQPMQVWVEYDGTEMQLNVTLSPLYMAKPNRPLLSSTINLSNVILDPMYVGFSSASGSIPTSHYILGWSFKMKGTAQALDLSSLPSLPLRSTNEKAKTLKIWLPSAVSAFVLVVVAIIVFIVIRRNNKFAEVLEDWELQYVPHRFSYKDLYNATNGFKDKELLGIGGFGRVYRGVLPTSKIEVAVKSVSHESRQGMKEFVAEIVSLGQLRHRNLVRLLGYCRRKRELLLVYDFMPNGSLDRFVFDQARATLEWSQRFRIIKDVASGLLYLHEDWEQVVIHRDIKASNVLLDGEFNGRLGDFGLARLYDHGTGPQTTQVVGTIGYLAPEVTRTSRASTAIDVFAFGVFLLEVACGRRPIQLQASVEELVLVDWVSENWKRGTILETRDPKLGSEYVVEEMELVLKLGLLCSHPMPTARPSMRQVMQFLDGAAPLPELSSNYLSTSIIRKVPQNEGFQDYIMSYPSSFGTESLLFGGR